jgi:nucleoid DNA-binding protein
LLSDHGHADRVKPANRKTDNFSVTKADIIERIAAGTGLTRLETEAVVNGFIHTVKDALLQNERVDLRGFGCFLVQERAARSARNPRTNQPIAVPASSLPVFKPSKEFRKEVDLRLGGTSK